MEETFDLMPSDEGRWGDDFAPSERASRARLAGMQRARWRKVIERHKHDLPIFAAVLAFVAAALIAMDFPTWVFIIPAVVYGGCLVKIRDKGEEIREEKEEER